MQFLKEIIKRPIKNSNIFKTVAFLRQQYRDHMDMVNVARDIALCEDGAVIEPGSEIYHPERIVLRSGSVIHRGCLINAIGGLHVGRCSGISYKCTIFTGDHRFLKANAIPFDKRSMIKPVFIEDFVMIGANVCIAPGVRIGEGAVIGIGSVVTRDVPALAIANGNPVQISGYRDKEHYEKLKRKKEYQCPIVGEYEEKIPLMYQRKYKEFLELIGLLKNIEQ